MIHLRFLFVALISIIFIPGCFHQSDDEVISNASNAANNIVARYDGLLNAPDDEAILECAQQFGVNNRISGWSGLWQNMTGNDHLTNVEGAPFHRTNYFIEGDINHVYRHLGYLESRMLTGIPLYERLRKIKNNLNYISHVIRTSQEYIQEDRYIEERRIQLQQLEAAQRQNALLDKIASKPVVITEEKVITTCQKPSKPIIIKETIREECCHDKSHDKKKKKKPVKKESEFNVGDACGKRPHIIV